MPLSLAEQENFKADFKAKVNFEHYSRDALKLELDNLITESQRIQSKCQVIIERLWETATPEEMDQWARDVKSFHEMMSIPLKPWTKENSEGC